MPPHKKKKRKIRIDKEQDRIVIIGGGLAGLSCAIALEQAGYTQVSLYERDNSLEQQKEGYGLTLTYNPKGPLAALGVLEQVAQKDCPSRSHYIFQDNGTILGYFGNAFSKPQHGNGQRGNLRVPRKVLRTLLFQKLSTTRVYWGHKLVDYQWNPTLESYQLNFETTDSTSSEIQQNVLVQANLLVAADGIRSSVLMKLYQISHLGKGSIQRSQSGLLTANNGLRQLGVRLILGIADYSHPLLEERGFYTLDGKHRLFTMPYSSNKFDFMYSSDEKDDKSHKGRSESPPRRVMWQLSFATDGNYCDDHLLDSESLRCYAIHTCQSWHAPVLDMIHATPPDSIWGTDLQDRDPKQVREMVEKLGIQRLVVVGDALHPMSPFKGQGANQALTDGPLLASCLQRASFDSAVTNFWREAVQRTAPVVAASRKAAKELHSPKVLQLHEFAGVKGDETPRFLNELQHVGIRAECGQSLDSQIQSKVMEMGVGESEVKFSVCLQEQEKALRSAARGDTQALRIQSVSKQVESIRTAIDEQQRTCLHLAVIGSHTETCKWLLTELGADATATDQFGMPAIHYAREKSIELLFKYV